MPIQPPGLLPFFTQPSPPERRPPTFKTLQIASTGLSSQLQRMEVIATNIANAETTRVGAAGSGPYRRRVVQMEEASTTMPPAVPPLLPLEPPAPGSETPQAADPTATLGGVQVTGVQEDSTEGPLVYDPGHPDADTRGYVRYPNVSVTDEIADLMDARRLYEANASVFQAAKLLLRRALDI